MAENPVNTGISTFNQSDSNGSGKRKRSQRKQLASAIQSNTNRTELTITAKISTTPKAVSDSTFPLNRAFLLSVESDEMYIKITKSKIVSLSTGDVFNSNVSGYLVIL
jgi:hypothetical protein